MKDEGFQKPEPCCVPIKVQERAVGQINSLQSRVSHKLYLRCANVMQYLWQK